MSEDLGRLISIENIQILYPKNIKLSDVEKMFASLTGIVELANGDKISVPIKASWQNKRYKIARIKADTRAFRKYKTAYLEPKP